jgi:hypothetical protein
MLRRLVRTSSVVVLAALAGLAAPPLHAEGGGPRWRRQRPEQPRQLPPPPGTGRLRNVAQGMCLDVAGWAAQGNQDVLLWECNNDPDQVWTFSPDRELRDVLTGACLDVAGYDGAQGANVGVFRCERLDDQRWTLVPRGDDTFELRSVKRGLCLDVKGKAGARGDDVMLWACDGDPDQRWRWEPYAMPAQRPPGPPQRSPVPPPSPPPPPQQPRERRPRAMEDGAFGALVAAIKGEGFSEGQLNVIRQAATRNFFTVAQTKALIELVSFSATKLSALEAAAPRIVDPENAFAIYGAFSFSADKEQAKQILQRNGM